MEDWASAIALEKVKEPRAAPGAAIVKVENVPARAANGLGEVEILFVAGEAVKKDDGGVIAGAGGEIEDAVHFSAVTGDGEFDEAGRVSGVERRVGGDGGGSGLRVRGGGSGLLGARGKCGEEESGEEGEGRCGDFHLDFFPFGRLVAVWGVAFDNFDLVLPAGFGCF